MNLFEAILLGLVQGLTEFLPVSSSGHLAILKQLLKVNTDTGILFETLLHLGTLIAVCLVLWKDVRNLVVHGIGLIGAVFHNGYIFVTNKIQKESKPYDRLIINAYRKFAALIIVTSVPTAIIGLALSSLIEMAAATLIMPGIGLVITAILLLLIDGKESGKKKVKATTYRDAAAVGVVQGIATFPGLSRSGSTIAACLFLGLDRSFAVRYSFLASIPAIIGANLLELRHVSTSGMTGVMIIYYLLGMVVAGGVGYICVRFMINIVKRGRYQYFAYYCAGIGLISIIGYFFIK